MAKVLIVFGTSEGHTREIADHIAVAARDAGHSVEVVPIGAAPRDLTSFDAAVVGSSVHFGRHNREVVGWCATHHEFLAKTPSAFFSVSMSAAGADDERRDDAARYVAEFCDETRWHPDVVGMFGGALVYTRYGWLKRHVMQHIARDKHADTDMRWDYDYTDWEAVAHFAADALARVS